MVLTPSSVPSPVPQPRGSSLQERVSSSEKWACVILGLICASMFLDVQTHAAGLRLRVFDFAFSVFTLIYALSLLIFRRTSKVPGQTVILAFSILVVYWTLNAFFLTSLTAAIKQVVQDLSFIAFFWILKDLLADERRFRIFFLSLLAGIWAMSLANAGLFFSRGTYYGFKDYGSIKLSHGYSLILTIAAASFFATRKNAIWFLGMIGIAGTLTIMAGERKAWLAVAAAIMISSAFTNTGRLAVGRFTRQGFLILGVALTLIAVAQTYPKENYLNKQVDSTIAAFNQYFNPAYSPLQDSRATISNRARIYIYDRAWQVFQEKPIFGMGVDGFVDYINRRSNNLGVGFGGGIHSEYIRILTESGVVGFGLYTLFLVIIIRRSVLCILSFRYLSPVLKFRTRLAMALLIFGIVMNAFKASAAVTFLVILLPAALLFFPSRIIVFPSGRRRLFALQEYAGVPGKNTSDHKSKLESDRPADASAS